MCICLSVCFQLKFSLTARMIWFSFTMKLRKGLHLFWVMAPPPLVITKKYISNFFCFFFPTLKDYIAPPE